MTLFPTVRHAVERTLWDCGIIKRETWTRHAPQGGDGWDPRDWRIDLYGFHADMIDCDNLDWRIEAMDIWRVFAAMGHRVQRTTTMIEGQRYNVAWVHDLCGDTAATCPRN